MILKYKNRFSKQKNYVKLNQALENMNITNLRKGYISQTYIFLFPRNPPM